METEVLIIGGGSTGTGIARDLALRGIDCILIDQKDINFGASGANHGLLHSGARYVFKDGLAASECHVENQLLKRLAPHCIEDTGGLFVAVEGDDDDYISQFPELCRKYGLPVREISVAAALEMEPCLSGNLKAAFEVADAVVDPFMLSLDNAAHAQANGATPMMNVALTGFDAVDGKILAARVRHGKTGREFTIQANQFVNATGAWADIVASMAGADISMSYSKGSLLITQERMNQRVINRLRPASDADILVPGGTVSIIGTTSIEIDNLDDIHPTTAEVDAIVREGACMVPSLGDARYIRAYAGVRPLVRTSGGDGRNISRNYTLKTHEQDN
ncbi:MAG: FAD-dependent oxidoreductase, partial [Desulfobacterales bacterium]|nr:FAD-dependent oxidoreductase [Desulfobacterales bacterium]